MKIDLPETSPPGAARKAYDALRRTVSRSKPLPWSVMPFRTVELSYWRPFKGVNFGDELSRTIVSLMLGRRGYTIFDETVDQRQLLAIGSVLHLAKDGAVVWGSGLNGTVANWEHRYNKIDVRAVRGPVTRHFLQQRGTVVPEVYGDPALLLPLISGDRFRRPRSREIGLVPNMFDSKFIATEGIMQGRDAISLIDPMRTWDRVVSDIVDHAFIIASSLHGLVIADAFGIPSRLLRLTDHESLLKYEDYYQGTGRKLEFATSIDEAIEMGGTAPLNWDATPLLNAFPYDIWRGEA